MDAKPCSQPQGATKEPCGQPARLYPAGWLCDDHCPAVSGCARIPGPTAKEATEQHALMAPDLDR